MLIFILSLAVIPKPIARAQAGPRPSRNEKGESVVVLLEKHKKATVSLGEILVVKLAAKLGTGYSWHVVSDGHPQLKIDGKPRTEEIPDDERQGKEPGAAQYQVFRFKPVAPGKHVLRMEYRRSFEPDAPARKTYSPEITVRRTRG
jgi:predicted secreted protein